jgi:hypothetical protein
MMITRLLYLSNASEIIFLSTLFWGCGSHKLMLLRSPGVWNSLRCVLFLTDLLMESEKVLNIKVVENFLSFLTMYSTS